MLESVKPLYLLGKTKKPVTITITGFTGDERIELPPKVLETPIIPFDQSPMNLYVNFVYCCNYTYKSNDCQVHCTFIINIF